MTDHEWCRDVRRDEQVRAAEDAAAVPSIQHRDLPEQVALLWASLGDIIGRVVRLEGEMDAGQDEEAAPAVCDSASPAKGLRTERVTLEVRWNPAGEPWSHVSEWLPAALLSEWFGAPGESVRVVEETTIGTGDVFADVQCGSTADEIARLTAERDAAIRERDAAREECERLLTMCAASPRGWLTAEEREAVQGCLRLVRQEISLLERYQPDHRWLDHRRRTDAVLSGLLDRAAGGEVADE